jgi:cell wall assembly regulator SMI1
MTYELPAWQQIERWLQQRVADLHRFALPPADPSAIAALERLLDRPLPTELRTWFGLHAGTTEALTFDEIERIPYWPLLTPTSIAKVWSALRRRYAGWLPSWLPLALSSSGSVTWYICCDLAPPGSAESGPIVLLDDADSDCFDPYPAASSLNEYFAPLARSMERGDLVAVGFDDEENAPPELMTQKAFASLCPDRYAYLLPRGGDCKEEVTCDETDEGLRFLHLLIARGQLLISSDADLGRLGTGLGKLLQSPRQCDERAHALCEWLADQPEVEEIYATDHEVVDLLEVW